MKVAILLVTVGIVISLHCDKDYDFDDRGYYITCQHLSTEHLDILEEITVNNELALKIENSKLDNVTSKLFQNVRKIRSLSIKDSTFTFSPIEHIFETLSNLEHLFIKNTSFNINWFTFSGMKRLKELVLYKNGLQAIEDGTLKDLEGLEYLRITENHLKDTTNIAMCDLKNLKSLNLSKNLIENVDKFFTICERPANSMDFTVNNLTHAFNVPKDDYTIYDFTSELLEFDLSYNKIKELGNLFDNFKYVRVIKLQGNLLSQLKNSDFKLLEDLKDLYLQENNITVIQDGVFHGKNSLENLDLSNNGLTLFSIEDLPMLSFLNLSSNRLKENSLNEINSTKSLQKLILDNNDIHELKPYTFQKFTELELLDLSSNHIKLNNVSLAGLSELKTLLLAENKIEILPELVFRDLENLKNLDLSRNQLKTLYTTSFQNLKSLNVLNMSHNHLEGLEYVLLQPIRKLHVLDVADNDLNYIQYDLIMSNLPSLSVLNIKENRLSCEFLIKIVGYLKHKAINYTMQEKKDSAQENVAGIFCTNEDNMESLKSANSDGSFNPLFNAMMTFITLFLVVIMGVIGFKIYVYLKRRKYRADEFELIAE